MLMRPRGVFLTLLYREWLLYCRKPSQIINPLLFFSLFISLFPLCLSVSLNTLQALVPGLMWMGLLLSSLLSMDRLFYDEVETGFLDYFINSPMLLRLILAKLVVYWGITLGPLLAAIPFIAVFYGLDASVASVASLALIVGSPTLVILLAFLAALAANTSSRNALLPLLLLPLALPILIFGAGAVNQSLQGLNSLPLLALLLGISLISIIVGPWVISQVVRLSVE